MASVDISFPTYVDSSMRTTYDACARKHLWGTVHSLYPMGRSIHLVAGAAFAAGLEHARKRVFLDPEPRSVDLQQMLEAAYPAYLLEWNGWHPLDTPKNFNTTWWALCHYLEQHPPWADEIQPWIRPDGTPAVEYKFAVPFDDILHPDTGEPIIFAGRFDMVGVMQAATTLVIGPCDEKTTGSLGYDWANQWGLRGQFLGYIWALRQQGIHATHAFVRGVAILKTKNETRTAIVKYPEYLIDRWIRRFKLDVQQMVESYKAYKELPDHHESLYPYSLGDACSSYGGCAFATLCEAQDATPFTTNYIRHRFNPLAKQPVEELTP